MFKRFISILLFCILIIYSKGQQIDFFKTYAIGGFSSYCGDMIITSDSNFVLTGEDWMFHGDQNVFIMKTDNQGNPIWHHIDTISSVEDRGTVVKETSNGDFVVAGVIEASVPKSFVLRYNSIGTQVWKKIISLPSQQFTINSMVEVNNYLYFFGYYDTSTPLKGFMLKLNEFGDSIGCNLNLPTIPGYEPTATMIYDSNQIIIAGGVYDTIISAYNSQLTVIDTNCNVVWQQTYISSLNNIAITLYQIPSGYILTSRGLGPEYIHVVNTQGVLLSESPLNASYPNSICYIDSSLILIPDGNINLLWIDNQYQFKDFETIAMPHNGNLQRAFYFQGKIIIAGSMSWGGSPVLGQAYLIQFSDSNIILSYVRLIPRNNTYVYPTICKASSFITFHADNFEVTKAILFNILGTQLKSAIPQRKNENEFIIKLNGVDEPGCYILQIESSNKKFQFKFLVE